jgi:hypothetical protein
MKERIEAIRTQSAQSAVDVEKENTKSIPSSDSSDLGDEALRLLNERFGKKKED